MNRYHPAIPAVASANPGDVIVIHTRDALDSDLTLDSIADDMAALDLNLVHPMTGPIHINGAKRGDALEVELLAIDPDEIRLHSDRSRLRVPARSLSRLPTS